MLGCMKELFVFHAVFLSQGHFFQFGQCGRDGKYIQKIYVMRWDSIEYCKNEEDRQFSVDKQKQNVYNINNEFILRT